MKLNETNKFYTPFGLIEYRVVEKNNKELLLLSNELDYSSPILIDRIYVKNQGNGNGKKIIDEFITLAKQEGYDLLYLFAVYDKYEYEKPKYSPVKGLKKLVSFYERNGFECCGKPEYGALYQIDMFMKLM